MHRCTTHRAIDRNERKRRTAVRQATAPGCSTAAAWGPGWAGRGSGRPGRAPEEGLGQCRSFPKGGLERLDEVPHPDRQETAGHVERMSRRAICRLMVGCVVPRSRATAEKLPASTVRVNSPMRAVRSMGALPCLCGHGRHVPSGRSRNVRARGRCAHARSGKGHRWWEVPRSVDGGLPS